MPLVKGSHNTTVWNRENQKDNYEKKEKRNGPEKERQW